MRYFFYLVISLFSFVYCEGIHGEPSDAGPWTRFTMLEQSAQNMLFESSNGLRPFQDFRDLYANDMPLAIQEIMARFDCEDPKLKELLQGLLFEDTRSAIDLAIAFVETKGAMSAKSKRLLRQWKWRTGRLFRALAQMNPGLNPDRLSVILDVRAGELYYFAQTLTTLNFKFNQKNVDAVIMHEDLAIESAQELDALFEVVLTPEKPCEKIEDKSDEDEDKNEDIDVDNNRPLA